MLEALLRSDIATESVATELESIKVIEDDFGKVTKQEGEKENVQLKIKRIIAKVKDKDIYFDLSTLKKTDETGKFVGGKISVEEIGKRFVKFVEGNKTKVYDISGPSLAEKVDSVIKILLGEKSDYKELLKVDASAGLKLLTSIYDIDEAKKMIDGFERFARDYNLFDENNKLKIEEAKKLFGDKFYIRTATGYVPISIGVLSRVSASTFAAPVLIATLSSLSGIFVVGSGIFAAETIRTKITRDEYIDKKNLNLIEKINKESKGILRKVKKP